MMRSYFKMIKPLDIIIVISLIILSFIPFFIFSVIHAGTVGKAYTAVISVNGEEIKQIDLTGHRGREIFDVHSDAGHVNTIEVYEGKIRIREADCRDQVCVLTGYISKPGETIVCLPNQVLIEITSDSGQDEDIIISS